MRKAFLYLVVALLLAQGGSLCLMAQTETGQITGTVTDATGAVIPNAKVTVKAVATQAVRTTLTAAAGNYTVTNVMPGVYEVTVEAPGFAKASKRAQVTVGARVGVDFKMEVGAATTVVEVTGEAGVLVNTETQTIGQVMNTQRVVELPTLTRNIYSLVGTAGTVSEDDPTGRGAGYAINGMRAASTNILLDGAANNDEFGGMVGQRVPLDAVQEFSVLTNNFTAEYGRASGGIVNVATKSGTNGLHGSVYEFNRVSDLASNDFRDNANGIDKSVFTRNQFGYSIGGPVKKDKLFFFQSTEWTRIRSGGTQFAMVPTPQLIAASAPATKDFFSKFGTLRPGLATLQTFTRQDLINRNADPCQGATSGPCAALSVNTPFFSKVAYSVPVDSGGGTPQNTYQLVGRIDFNKSDKTQVYGRYALENEFDLEGANGNSSWAGYDSTNKNINNNILLSVVHTFTPSFVSQSKIVFNRINNIQPLGANPPSPTLYFNPTVAATLLGTAVELPGYLPRGPGTAIPFGGPQNFFQFYQDLSKMKGRHNVRFGGSWVHMQDNRTFGAYMEPVAALGTNLNRAAMENFLTGYLRTFQAAIDPQGKLPCADTNKPTANCMLTLPVGQPSFSRSNRYNEYAYYIQDSWKVKPRLTVNLGLRWEYYGVQHNKNPKLDSNYYDGTGTDVFTRVRNGQIMVAPNSPIGGLWGKDYRDYAPRVGFAYDLFGNGKSSIRGGYGIGYERNFGNVTFNVIQNPPAYAVISLQAGVDIPTIPIPTSLAGPLAGSSGTKAFPKTSMRNVDATIKTAYAHLWSFSFEHELSKSIFLGVDYSGSKGVRLYTIENPNLIGAGNYYLGDACKPGVECDPGTCVNRLQDKWVTNINRRGGNGFSTYDAVNLRVEIRNWAKTGLNLRTNYTVGHSVDNLSSTFSESGNNQNLGLLDPFNPGLDRGDSEFDNRQRIAISGTWDVPFAKNTKHVAKQVLDGWALAPIITARTGSPFTIYDWTMGYSVAPRMMEKSHIPRSGSGNPKPSGEPDNFIYIDLPASTIDSTWYNPKTGIADFGPFPSNMTKRNAFRSPGVWNWDMGIYKNFKLTEVRKLQFRAETYNMYNHANLYVIAGSNDVYSNSYIPAERTGRRNVQLALKFIF
jgi:outer membrane receptor protein involved in Fe transport